MGIVYALLAAVFAASVVVLTKAGLKDLDSNLAFAIQSVFIIVITWSIVAVQGTAGGLKDIDRRT